MILNLDATNSMNAQFHSRGLNDNSDFRRRLLHSLERLQSDMAVTAVAVVLERQRNEAPPFRVYVSLAVPGPDLHAEARDHTLAAAWLKATTDLRRQIERRRSRQYARLKKHRQLHATTGSLARAMAAARI